MKSGGVGGGGGGDIRVKNTIFIARSQKSSSHIMTITQDGPSFVWYKSLIALE